MNKLMTLMKDESGATLIEYALLAALIAIVSITVLTGLGKGISTQFSSINVAIAR